MAKRGRDSDEDDEPYSDELGDYPEEDIYPEDPEELAERADGSGALSYTDEVYQSIDRLADPATEDYDVIVQPVSINRSLVFAMYIPQICVY